MRITVDIDDAIMKELIRMTGEKKKSPAVAKVVTDWFKRQKAKEFGKKLVEGHYHFAFTNDEIEALDR